MLTEGPVATRINSDWSLVSFSASGRSPDNSQGQPARSFSRAIHFYPTCLRTSTKTPLSRPPADFPALDRHFAL